MTATVPFSWAIPKQILSQTNRVLTRLDQSSPLLRVTCSYRAVFNSSQTHPKPCPSRSPFAIVRGYATEAALKKPASKPKAHTGRTTSGKATARKATATKPDPKTTAGKKKGGRPKKAKAKAKAKPKPKPKVKTNKPPSAAALKRATLAKTKVLKEKALLDPPKKLPQTVWAIIFSEAHSKGVSLADGQNATKEAAQKLKHLSPEDHESYNKMANANKSKNDEEHQKWLAGFTPEQIMEANNARAALARQEKAKTTGKKHVQKYSAIKDERTVKRPIGAYTLFSKDRFSSGDFRNMTVAESAKLIGREWKDLSSAEKKPYQDQYTADRNRYIEEYKTVYGRDPHMLSAKAASAA